MNSRVTSSTRINMYYREPSALFNYFLLLVNVSNLLAFNNSISRVL